MKKIWDISPPVDAQAAIFPGDTAYSQQLHFTLGPDCPVNVNAITLSPGKQTISWTDIASGWTGASFSAVGAIIYLNTGVAANDLLLHFVDFGGTVTCTAGTFSIDYTSTFDITV